VPVAPATGRLSAVDILGITTDLPVSALPLAVPFYTAVLGRPADLAPDDRTAEWILHRDPEIALRLIESRSDRPDEASPGTVRVGIGVPDAAAERTRLLAHFPELPPVAVRPNVIALLELPDPDGNRLVLWQDLLIRRPG
jgi:catechol 2,3-dioxygenase-like lactoylglutathione lyase family enzyme